MKIPRLASVVAGAALVLLAVVRSSAAAPDTDFPSKPIKLVVTFAPGGGSDILARIVVARSPTDGYAAATWAEIAKFDRIVREGYITVQ